jgi:hypothetical protein
MRKPIVHLYTICWDEADMLGFFFRHYDSWIDRYVIYDDGSTDGSLDILRAHPKVEVCSFERVNPDSFVLSHTALQDEVWKESRGRADWVVITAIDEHLWIPGKSMAAYLSVQQEHGVTLVPALGFDMISQTMPQDEGLLIDQVHQGQPSVLYSKLSLFDPNALTETNFAKGRHAAQPTGKLVLPERDELVLWHFKRLGFERTAAREKAQGARLGGVDITHGWGFQYLWSAEKFASEWEKFRQDSLWLNPRSLRSARPKARRLWWTWYQTAVRVTPRWSWLGKMLRAILPTR